MDYAGNSTMQPAGLGQASPAPALGQLKAAAELISKITDKVESFVGRFNGQPSAICGAAGAGVQPSAGTYRNDLESLSAVIERLECAVDQLGTIG